MKEAGKMRIAKWDNVKLFLIICVVVGHVLARQLNTGVNIRRLYLILYQFHMPAFVFVSGLFAKKAVRGKQVDRAFSFLLLYFFMNIVEFAVAFTVEGKRTLSLFWEIGVPWYALAMCAWYGMTMYLQRFRRGYLLILSVVLGCLAGYDENIGKFLALSRILAFYPFFLAGFFADRDRLLALMRKKEVKAAAAVVLLLIVVVVVRYIDDLYWLRELMKGRYPYTKLKKLNGYGGLLRLGWYAVSGAMSFAVITLIPERRFCFSGIGARTLAVFALHYPILTILRRAFHWESFLKQLWPEHFHILLLLTALFLVAFLSLGPFDRLVRFIIMPGRAEKDE